MNVDHGTRARRRASALVAAAALALLPTARADDLLTVWRHAQTQDPTYAAARHALEMTQEKLPQARAALLPSLSLVAGHSQQAGASSFDGAAEVTREVRASHWSVQLAQPLLRPDRWAALDQAQALLRQGQEQFRLAGQDLMLRVAQAYFDVLVAQESEGVARHQLDAVGAQLGLAQRNYDVGTSTITDVHEARSRFELARAQRVAATAELHNRQADLEKMLGALPPRLAGLRADAQLPAPDPADAGAWTGRARQNHPQVGQLQAALDAAGFELARQRAGHAPSLDLTASRGGNFNSGSLSTPADLAVRTRSTQVGLQLTVPLHAGGGTQSRVREALAAHDKAHSELLAAQRQAVAQASQAFAGVMQGRAQVEALDAAVAASASAADANKIGYRIGTRINTDVLNAQQQLYTARCDLFKARVDTLIQSLRLKAAAGSLLEQDLREINALLAEPSPLAGPQGEGSRP